MKNVSIFLCCFFSFTLGLGVMCLCTYTKKDPLTRIRESMITNKIDVDAALCRYLRENKDLMDDIQKKILFLDVMRSFPLREGVFSSVVETVFSELSPQMRNSLMETLKMEMKQEQQLYYCFKLGGTSPEYFALIDKLEKIDENVESQANSEK